MTALQPDSVFATRYRIARVIAAGGMGAVYECVHIETERKRALKVMHAHFVQSPELRDRFKREAKVAAQIDSEFIVDVFDAGVDEPSGMPFLVMELLKGEELGKRLERVGRFAPPDAITYLWQTALALDKTHKANIVHRDLKPENLFLTQREDGPPRIKVLDFGVAKFVAETGTSGATRSLGTPLYMSPEQFRSQRVSPASDIFALSLMAYTLLVGEAYWSTEASGDVDIIGFGMKAVFGPTEPATVRAARRGVTLPAAFDAWFFRSTASDPTVRPTTASACIAALGEAFGLNPARMSGLGSSDPLPALSASTTTPLGSGFDGQHVQTGPSASAPQMMGPGGSGRFPSNPAGAYAAGQSQPALPGQTGSGVGAMQATVPAVALPHTGAPVKNGVGMGFFVGIGALVVACAGAGIYFVTQANKVPKPASTGVTATTSTATATAAPKASAEAVASATATKETAAPTATSTASAEIAETDAPPSSAKTADKPPEKPAEHPVAPPPVKPQIPTAKPVQKPPSSGAYTQD